MAKYFRFPLVLYGVLLLVSIAFAVYYSVVAAPRVAIYYEMLPYYLKLYLMDPLLYGSLAAFVTELVQQAGILRLPDKKKWVYIALAAAILVLYVIWFGLIATGRYFPIWPVAYPQIFLIPGFLAAVGLHRNSAL